MLFFGFVLYSANINIFSLGLAHIDSKTVEDIFKGVLNTDANQEGTQTTGQFISALNFQLNILFKIFEDSTYKFVYYAK